MFRKRRLDSAYVPPRGTIASLPATKVTNNLTYEEEGRKRDAASVLATWLENFGGGLGVTLAWLVTSYALHAALYAGDTLAGAPLGITSWPDPLRVGLASLAAGVFVFAILMILRSAIDEIVTSGEWNELKDNYSALEQEFAEYQAQAENDYGILQRAYNQVKADNSLMLHKGGAVTPVRYAEEEPTALPANVPQSFTDSLTLLKLAYTQRSWSRDTLLAAPYKWTREQWTEARRWLLDAGVLWYEPGKPNVPNWVHEDDMQAALLQLEERARAQLGVRAL